jgi:hypothetical protein
MVSKPEFVPTPRRPEWVSPAIRRRVLSRIIALSKAMTPLAEHERAAIEKSTFSSRR